MSTAEEKELYAQMLEKMFRTQESGIVFKNVERNEAIAFLEKEGAGSYVVRPSKAQGSLSVSYNSEGQIGHTLVKKGFAGWQIEGVNADDATSYRTLTELLKAEFYGLKVAGEITQGTAALEAQAATTAAAAAASAPSQSYEALPKGLVEDAMNQARSSGAFHPGQSMTDVSREKMLRMTEPSIRYASVSRETAEEKLAAAAPGAHLVRPARSDDSLVVSYKHKDDGALRHVLITRYNGGWKCDEDEHEAFTVAALVEKIAADYGIDPAAKSPVQDAAPVAYDPMSLQKSADELWGAESFWRPNFNRQLAESTLAAVDNKALVRPSSAADKFAVVTYRKDGQIYHTPIQMDSDEVLTMQGLDDELFNSIHDIFTFLGVTPLEAAKVEVESNYDVLPSELSAALLLGKKRFQTLFNGGRRIRWPLSALECAPFLTPEADASDEEVAAEHRSMENKEPLTAAFVQSVVAASLSSVAPHRSSAISASRNEGAIFLASNRERPDERYVLKIFDGSRAHFARREVLLSYALCELGAASHAPKIGYFPRFLGTDRHAIIRRFYVGTDGRALFDDAAAASLDDAFARVPPQTLVDQYAMRYVLLADYDLENPGNVILARHRRLTPKVIVHIDGESILPTRAMVADDAPAHEPIAGTRAWRQLYAERLGADAFCAAQLANSENPLLRLLYLHAVRSGGGGDGGDDVDDAHLVRMARRLTLSEAVRWRALEARPHLEQLVRTSAILPLEALQHNTTEFQHVLDHWQKLENISFYDLLVGR